MFLFQNLFPPKPKGGRKRFPLMRGKIVSLYCFMNDGYHYIDDMPRIFLSHYPLILALLIEEINDIYIYEVTFMQSINIFMEYI